MPAIWALSVPIHGVPMPHAPMPFVLSPTRYVLFSMPCRPCAMLLCACCALPGTDRVYCGTAG
eukprot:1551988-Rhodomonas_salina.2